MSSILKLAMTNAEPDLWAPPGVPYYVEKRNLYELPRLTLSEYAGMIISMSCDQVFVEKHSETLTHWVEDGGRLLINGHLLRRIVQPQPISRKLDFRGAADIWLSPVSPHPIWEGINRDDVVLRTGVPGQHSLEELKNIGVAGFYGRAYLADLPDNTTVITGLGPFALPVDVSYPIGAGEVIIHHGNDLESFTTEGTSAAHFDLQIYSYLAGEHHEF